MTPGEQDRLGPWLDAGATALGLAVEPAWRPAILSHLAVCLCHGAAVLAFALPDDAEPAPVFAA